MAFEREIVRDERMEIRLSKEEKELFNAFAKQMGMMPGRLARNIIMAQANAKLENAINIPLVKAYREYLRVTKQFKLLEEIEKGE